MPFHGGLVGPGKLEATCRDASCWLPLSMLPFGHAFGANWVEATEFSLSTEPKRPRLVQFFSLSAVDEHGFFQKYTLSRCSVPPCLCSCSMINFWHSGRAELHWVCVSLFDRVLSSSAYLSPRLLGEVEWKAPPVGCNGAFDLGSPSQHSNHFHWLLHLPDTPRLSDCNGALTFGCHNLLCHQRDADQSSPYLFFLLACAERISVPFFRALWVITALCILLLCLRALPGRPRGSRLLTVIPPRFVVLAVILPLGVLGRPDTPVLPQKKPFCQRSRRSPRHIWCSGLWPFAFLCSALPVCVWSAPPGLARELQLLEGLLDALARPAQAITLPEDLPTEPRRSSFAEMVEEALRPVPEPEVVTASCVILIPGFPSAQGVIQGPAFRDSLTLFRAAEQLYHQPNFPAQLHWAFPQPSRDYLTFVASPPWLAEVDKVTYVIDCSGCQGPIFSVIGWFKVGLWDLRQATVGLNLGEWEGFAPQSAEALLPGQEVKVCNGDVFRLLPVSCLPPHTPSLGDWLADPYLWQVCSHPVQLEQPCNKWMALQSHVSCTPEYAGQDTLELRDIVARSFENSRAELQFGQPLPNSSLQHLVHRGQLLRGMIAAAPSTHEHSHVSNTGIFVFLDFRHLGIPPAFLFRSSGWISLPDLLRSIGFAVPIEYSAKVSGVPFCDDRFQVSANCTVVIYLEADGCSSNRPVQASTPQTTTGAACGRLAPQAGEAHGPAAAAITTGPTRFLRDDAEAPDTHELLGLHEPAEREFMQAGFLVLSPRYIPEVIQLALRVPCDSDTALHEIQDSRQAASTTSCDCMLPACPQPDTSFGAILAFPEWLRDLHCVLVDARAVDQRLFAVTLPPSINRSSVLLHVGVVDTPGLKVYFKDRLLQPEGMYDTEHGMTVFILPFGRAFPPRATFAQLLESHRNWVMPCPLFTGPHEAAFCVLSDGGQQVIAVNMEDIHSPQDFKQIAAERLQYSLERTTSCPSVPRVTDLDVLGVGCKALLAATERISRIPIPPGIWQPLQHMIFIDRRPIFLNCTWMQLTEGRLDERSFLAPYQEITPQGFYVQFRVLPPNMAPYEATGILPHGSLLVLEFVPWDEEEGESEPPSRRSSDVDDHETDSSSSEDSTNSPPRDRSRSRSARTGGSPAPRPSHLGPTERPKESKADLYRGKCCFVGGALLSREIGLREAIVRTSYQVSSCLSFASGAGATFSGLRTLKILSEPVTRGRSERLRLRNLRLCTHQLGAPWPYLEDGDVPRDPLPDGQVATQATALPTLNPLHIAILKPDFAIEEVVVRLPHPVDVPDVYAAVQQSREPTLGRIWPLLYSVWPQPSTKWATMIALPAWITHDISICIDSRAVDGRVFTTLAPNPACRADILRLAGLLGRRDLDVYTPLRQTPLEDPHEARLSIGLCLSIVPRGHMPSPILALEALILFPLSWRPGPVFPVDHPDDCYCAVTEGGSRLFCTAPARAPYHRQDLADFLPCPISRLRVAPALPRIGDSADKGWPCRTVFAVASSAGAPASEDSCLFLVDCRALLQGWYTSWAEHGWIHKRALEEELSAFAPPGFHAQVSGLPVHDEWIQVQSGQWLNAQYVPFERCAFVTPFPEAPHTPTRPPESSQPGVHRALAPATTPQVAPSTPTSTSVMWRCGHNHDDLTRGSHTLTPDHEVLQLIICLQIVGALVLHWDLLLQHRASLGLDAKSFPANKCGIDKPFRRDLVVSGPNYSGKIAGNRLFQSLIIATFCCRPTTGVQYPAVGTTPKPATFGPVTFPPTTGRIGNVVSHDLAPRARPLPTPCRSVRTPIAHVGLDTDLVDYAADGVDILRTLLECSVRDDPLPFFLAATLIETLMEHFDDVTAPHISCIPPIVSTSDVRVVGVAPATLSLSQLVPASIARPLSSRRCPFALQVGGRPQSEEVCVGGSLCGFTWGAVQELLELTFKLSDLSAYSGLHEFAHALPHAIHSLSPHHNGSLLCYTDGSFFPAKNASKEALGWAFILICPETHRLVCSTGPVPDWAVAESDRASAFLAECFALLMAYLCTAINFAQFNVVFRSDCQAAIGIAEGHMTPQSGGVPQAIANAAVFRRSILPSRDQIQYVPGHSGHVFNEIVDRLAKQGARLPRFCPVPDSSLDVLTTWIRQGGVRLAWAATALRSLAGDLSLPPLQGPLGSDSWHGPLTISQLVEPFIPAGAADVDTTQQPIDSRVQLQLVVLSFNTLSLGASIEEDNGGGEGEAGLRYRPGRAALLEKQLHQMQVMIAALQETRSPTGTLRAGHFIRFCSGADHGQFGTEVWLNASVPFLLPGRTTDESLFFSEQNAVIVHADPRRMLVRFHAGTCKMLIASLHAPHRGHERHAIQEWWRTTRTLVHKFGQLAWVVLAGDMNASIGSITSQHVGEVGSETEDLPGQYWHSLLREFECFLPCTMSPFQQGDTVTYVQKRNKQGCRPDMIGIPTLWQSGAISAWVADEVHVALSCQDHFATCVKIAVDMAMPVKKAARAGRRISAEAILDPANATAIRDMLAHMPTIPWHLSSHAHAATLVQYLQQGLRRISHASTAKPRSPYLTEPTWQLQREVTQWKRSYRRLREHKRAQMRAACFLAWRRQPSADIADDTSLSCDNWMFSVALAELVHCHRLASLCRRLRKACRDDRDRYLSDLAEQVAQRPCNEVFQALHKLLCHKRKKPYTAEPLPLIYDARGEVCATPEEVRRRWREHFGAMEGGKDSTFAQLPTALLAWEEKATEWPVPASTLHLPSLADLQSVMAKPNLVKLRAPTEYQVPF